MQQEGRKKRTAEHLCVTNMTGLLLACSVVILLNINVFWSLTKISFQRKMKFEAIVSQTKLLSHLSHKV